MDCTFSCLSWIYKVNFRLQRRVTLSTEAVVSLTGFVHHVVLNSTGVAQGGRVLVGMLIPPPLRDKVGPPTELALLTRLESRNTTITVMSSWKCRRTPRSIFFKSEYLISLFLAASCKAAFTSLRALPCKTTCR